MFVILAKMILPPCDSDVTTALYSLNAEHLLSMSPMLMLYLKSASFSITIDLSGVKLFKSIISKTSTSSKYFNLLNTTLTNRQTMRMTGCIILTYVNVVGHPLKSVESKKTGGTAVFIFHSFIHDLNFKIVDF